MRFSVLHFSFITMHVTLQLNWALLHQTCFTQLYRFFLRFQRCLQCQQQNKLLCFVDSASLYNLANKSNSVHNSAYYIYFSSLCVSGNHVPVIRRNYCNYVTLVFVTLCGWRPVCWLEFLSPSLADKCN